MMGTIPNLTVFISAFEQVACGLSTFSALEKCNYWNLRRVDIITISLKRGM